MSVMSHKKPPASIRREDVHWNIETELEDDGRWIAEIAAVPGAIVYGKTEDEAKRKAYALALRVIADDVENSENVPRSITLDCASA
jgi:predicted RNase H-like HicB family nuclease